MDLKYKTIEEYRLGERIDSFLMIKRVQLKVSSASQKKFLDFLLGDATGEISAKLWEVPGNLEAYFQVNDVVRVRGTVTDFMDRLQLKIERIRLKTPEDQVNPETLVAAAPLSPEYMYGEILSRYIEPIENSDMRLIVEELFRQNEEKLMYYPAAKRYHHAIRSGLLYHILTMLHLADQIILVYPFLNRDLLMAGIVLHDLCKLKEMDSSELGIVREYTVAGTLLGHISMGMEEIGHVGRTLQADPEVIMLLQHMVLSHHYEPEFGSPVKPMVPEAELLHYIDLIDARMYDMQHIQENLEPGRFSDFMPSLDRRRIYRPILEPHASN
ncbi:3'-_5' exoribonuclease Bsu YhaM [Clostridiaceae bacterium JG1575]|nr:3'->5' exoribonuclease Bsu YhaM [Clostridiaceae bacterium JG1575]